MVNASEVKAKLDTHEAVCSERWRETITRIKRIEAIMISVSAASLLLLITLIVK